MRRFLLAALLALAFSTGAAARPPMETNQLVDDAGVPIGTAGNPLNVTSADGVVTAYAISGTGTQTGVPLSGYGSVLIEAVGTFSASIFAQTSSDTTDGINGNWTTVLGSAPDDAGTTAPGGSLTATVKRRLFRAQDGLWIRLNTTSYTSGAPIAVTLTRRTAPSGERAVYVGGGSINATLNSAGTNRSATVATTAANLMALNASRRGWKIKNDCANAVWINFDTTATAAAGSGNIKIAAGGYLASEPGFVETGAMSAIAETSSCAITAREH